MPGVIMLLALAGALWAPANQVRANNTVMPSKTVSEALREQADRLLAIPGVVGVGQGLCDGQPCIKVYVIKRTPDLMERIPSTIEGFPVEVEETGEFRALPGKER